MVDRAEEMELVEHYLHGARVYVSVMKRTSGFNLLTILRPEVSLTISIVESSSISFSYVTDFVYCISLLSSSSWLISDVVGAA